MNKTIFLCILIILLIGSALIQNATNAYVSCSTTPVEILQVLEVTASTNKKVYYTKEIVAIYGSVYHYGNPVENALVAVEVQSPSNSPIAFRTISTGPNITEGPIKILDVVPCDQSLQPKNSFETGSFAYFKVSMRNEADEPHSAFVSLTVFDGSLIPIGVAYVKSSLNPGDAIFLLSIPIPLWSYIGKASAVVNVCTDRPSEGGVPYCLERITHFNIVRGELVLGESQGLTPEETSTTTDGTYNLSLRLSPGQMPGLYTVYIVASKEFYQATTYTTYNVAESPSPPQASFTYYPLEVYVNMTITFDPSSSTAEGYNDYITRYEWNFGDGSPIVVKYGDPDQPPPTVTHKYISVGTYTVTLNVTDNEGLWCITSKPIIVLPPTGPKANFTWSPQYPYVNQTITFDASSCEPGWNGTAHPEIISYEWDFGDGNITATNNPKITHVYSSVGNYTVTLTITDEGGLSDSISYTIEVVQPPQLEGDINGDGIVDIRDLSIVGRAFGSYPGHPYWDPNADLNGDGIVDIRDLSIVGRHFGEHI